MKRKRDVNSLSIVNVAVLTIQLGAQTQRKQYSNKKSQPYDVADVETIDEKAIDDFVRYLANFLNSFFVYPAHSMFYCDVDSLTIPLFSKITMSI
mmetsp:Transcript_51562/g.62129  ORF Transcript_51562/g.62129 Transcript_51562/m.62129 type:complete len:95 (+) Transcript_51562:3-287(+)